MSFEVETKTLKWLLTTKIITPTDVKQLSSSSFEVKESVAPQFQNGSKVSSIVMEIYKKKGLPIPGTLNHIKMSNNTAAMLYNWNILNDALKKMDFQIDSETKNLIINGDRAYLAMTIRKLYKLYETNDYEDSLEADQTNNFDFQKENSLKQSLSLSRSQSPQKSSNFKSANLVNTIEKMRKTETRQSMATGDLLQFVVNQLTHCLKLSRKQAVTLLSDNNKYLAHVLVKGVKGQFVEIQELLQRFYSEIDFIVEKMMTQNDMCFYFLQIIKPCLLSKSEEIAQWGCRILTKIANELANKSMLPLAYDWFVQEAGGLSTTILALNRHPKLNQHVVSFILQFSRYNVTELFTIQLKKITKNDQLAYVKFMLLIFNPLVQSKISAEQLLNSGAIDYWVQITIKGAENEPKNPKQLRMYCIEFLIKIWRAYPSHIEETLDQVNNIMMYMKRGIREDSQVMRFCLMEMMFDLLDEFANKKNPYASIVYKKITFLFIENHEELTMREFMLRNIQKIFQRYSTIPVDIFLQPFIKQIKISESKSYLVNIFDMEFINVAVRHKKLKVAIGLELFDLLAKTKLNSFSFSIFATQSMEVLIDRFIQEDIFLEYTVKLVKISLAMFYSTLKQKKPHEDQERLQAQKRAEIVNFIISLIERSHQQLNEEIKMLVVHVKVQILNKLDIKHKGIQRILGYFSDVDDAIREVMENMKDQLSSNATSTAKNNFHLPKIQSRNMMLKDQTSSQYSFQSNGTKYSQASRQQFPTKDYTEFATDDEKKFLKENGLGLKKKGMNKRKGYSMEKEHVDPKIQQQIYKVKLRKEEEERKKQKEKQYLERKKQLLKIKIQQELQQRNIKQGVKGNEKDVVVKVLFEENEINEKILEEDEEDYYKDINLMKEEERDEESIKIILKRYNGFIRKVFTRYCNLKGKKDPQTEELSHVDLMRMCKEKNIEKNKNVITELLKSVNNKNVKSLTIDTFFKFLEALCVSVYIKEKCKTNMIMGDLMKKILRRLSQGQNFKLDDDDDEMCNNLSEKVRYNPHIQLPENFKKIYERSFKVNENCSYPTQKAVSNKYVVCYEVLNEILKKALKVNVIEEQVRFFEEARVIHKKQYYLPPKPLKKEDHQITLLEEREAPPQVKSKKHNRTYSRKNQSVEKQNNQSKSRSKIVNPAQTKRIEEEEQKQKRKEQEEQVRKQRALEVRKKLQQQQQERDREKQRKKMQKKASEEREEEKSRREKERKQKYNRDQKQRVQKYRKEQEEKEKQQKQKQQVVKQKQNEEKKLKLKEQMRKDDEKRKQEYERMKKERELSEQKNKKKKEEEQKKKQLLKKQMMKKIQDEKEKLQINKLSKEVLRKIYFQPEIQELINHKYKEELKAIFNYGKEFNQFKLDKGNTNVMEQKGWITLCQQLSFCDTPTANKIIKMHLKETNSNGFNFEDFQRTLFQMSVKKEIEADLEEYNKAKKICQEKFDKFLQGLKLPKQNQKLKGYFINLKNQLNKKKEEMVVTNPDGKKQTWEINQ